jgi:hypothetical protein
MDKKHLKKLIQEVISQCLEGEVDEMTTTAAVQGFQSPHAFKKNKNIKEGDEEDPLYVEYVRERPGESPFMMNGQKFQYVTAKYPNGKEDIGVYAFAGDMVYSYNAFRQMHNIKEEQGSEMYDDKTDTMAPGPRERPEDWQQGEASGPKFETHYAVSGLENIPPSTHNSKKEALIAAVEFLKTYVTTKSKQAGEKLVKLKPGETASGHEGYAITHVGGGTVAIATVKPYAGPKHR